MSTGGPAPGTSHPSVKPGQLFLPPGPIVLGLGMASPQPGLLAEEEEKQKWEAAILCGQGPCCVPGSEPREQVRS